MCLQLCCPWHISYRILHPQPACLCGVLFFLLDSCAKELAKQCQTHPSSVLDSPSNSVNIHHLNICIYLYMIIYDVSWLHTIATISIYINLYHTTNIYQPHILRSSPLHPSTSHYKVLPPAQLGKQMNKYCSVDRLKHFVYYTCNPKNCKCILFLSVPLYKMPPSVSQDKHMKKCVYWRCLKAFCTLTTIECHWCTMMISMMHINDH